MRVFLIERRESTVRGPRQHSPRPVVTRVARPSCATSYRGCDHLVTMNRKLVKGTTPQHR